MKVSEQMQQRFLELTLRTGDLFEPAVSSTCMGLSIFVSPEHKNR